MRNILKATTLESKLPLLAVEHGCIISKDADITVAFEVSLPELFTVTSAEYEAMHGAWCKAIKVLPHYSVVHKQDWFCSEKYQPELQKDDLSFLDRSFERHFNERPYLAHKCFLFLTKTTKERARQQSNISTLCRGRISPKELNHEMVVKFMESVEQFERIINDTGNSYEGLCNLIHNKTHGEDGVYYTYTEDSPISFNPFYTDDGVFDVEKKDSIKTLLLTLWKSEDDRVSKTESGELGSALSMFLEKMAKDKVIVPCFDSFYEFMRDEYRAEMAQRPIPIYKQDFDIDNFLTTLRQYYHGGRFDFLLNSKENIDLLGKRFIVFEIDSIKDNKELFPVVTIIIMEAFINKMRRLKGIRKVLICEEAWKALSSANMAEYMKYLYKTVRKYFGEAVVVTQEVDDIISSPIVKETIINNSDCKILLDQRKYMNRFDQIQELLSLTDKEKSQILSINMANNPNRLYKEVWIGLGGTQSAVYATEVSTEEYLCYTTEETEKIQVLNKAAQLGGSVEAAIKMLANERREGAT